MSIGLSSGTALEAAVELYERWAAQPQDGAAKDPR